MMNLASRLNEWLAQSWEDAHGTDFPSGWRATDRKDGVGMIHSAALLQARALNKPARQVADEWLKFIPENELVSSVEVMSQGHLVVKLSEAGWRLFFEGGAFALDKPIAGSPTLVEFVSASPTGPLNVNQGRQAVFGDVIKRLKCRVSSAVKSEFFYNEDGFQIDLLEISAILRIQEEKGVKILYARDGSIEGDLKEGELLFPAKGYHGEYIRELAKEWIELGHDIESDGLRDFLIDAVQYKQQEELRAINVVFEDFVSERMLRENGAVHNTLERMKNNGYLGAKTKQEVTTHEDLEKPHSWFFEGTNYGEDKDYVMVKSDGTVMPFVIDIAYHLHKYDRGWMRSVNVTGFDRLSNLKKLKAGILALRPEMGENYPVAISPANVRVVKNNMSVKSSQKAGDYLAMIDVVETIGADAFRLAMIEKDENTQIVLDLDFWEDLSPKNPLFTIHNASSKLYNAVSKNQLDEEFYENETFKGFVEQEIVLINNLLFIEDRINVAANDMSPVMMRNITVELANSINEAYQKGPRLMTLKGKSKNARVQLYIHAHKALKRCCNILGISCPDEMKKKSS